MKRMRMLVCGVLGTMAAMTGCAGGDEPSALEAEEARDGAHMTLIEAIETEDRVSYYLEDGDVLRVLELLEDEQGVPFARVLNEALEPLSELRLENDGTLRRVDLAGLDSHAWALLQPSVLGELPESARFPVSALVSSTAAAPKLIGSGTIGIGAGTVIVILCPGGNAACMSRCRMNCGPTPPPPYDRDHEDCIDTCSTLCRGLCPTRFANVAP